MEINKNAVVIAQKEFADNIWSQKFILMILAFSFIVFSKSYLQGIEAEENIFNSFLDVAQIISLFLPFMGIALGFDVINKERNAGSLNVLLTHPVYRDTIITGKILGAMITLALVVFVSISTVIGTMLLASGSELTSLMFYRLIIFATLTYLYLSIFMALGTLSSIITKNSTRSLIYNITIWIVLCVAFGMIVATTASIITKHNPLDLDNNEQFLEFNANIQKLSPSHHYSMALCGRPSFSWLGFSSNKPEIRGIFDTGYTLEQWCSEFWTNVAILTITPILLIITSFMVFLRQDITIDMER